MHQPFISLQTCPTHHHTEGFLTRPCQNSRQEPLGQFLIFFFNFTCADDVKPYFNQEFYFRADDFNDPSHLGKITTLNTFIVKDLGAIPNGSLSADYTSDYYRINEWYVVELLIILSSIGGKKKRITS